MGKLGAVVVCMMENLGDLCAMLVWVKYSSFGSKISEKRGDSCGMELPRVGAFTEKWGS